MNLNKVFLIGRLTRDPQNKVLPSGSQVTNFGIATNTFYNDREKTGEKKQQTEFHNIVAFGRLAEIASQYLNKGSLVLIEGRIQTRSWDDPSGIKKYRTEVVAQTMQLGPKFGGDKGFTPSSHEQAKEGKTSDAEIPIIDEEEIDIKDIPF